MLKSSPSDQVRRSSSPSMSVENTPTVEEVCSRRYPHLQAQDPEIFRLVVAQSEHEYNTLKMIPSENYASFAVLEATGSIRAYLR